MTQLALRRPPAPAPAKKMLEVDRLTQYAMCSHVFLSRYAISVAGSDPIVQEDLQTFLTANRTCKLMMIQGAAE